MSEVIPAPGELTRLTIKTSRPASRARMILLEDRVLKVDDPVAHALLVAMPVIVQVACDGAPQVAALPVSPRDGGLGPVGAPAIDAHV